jgi:hypothetical protein
MGWAGSDGLDTGQELTAMEVADGGEKGMESGKSGGQLLIAVANSNLERWIAADRGGTT